MAGIEKGVNFPVTATDGFSATFAALKSQVKDAGRNFEDLKSLMTTAFAGVSIAGLGAMVKGAIDAMDRLNELAHTTSLTVETLSGLSLAAKQSGADLESIASTLNKLAVNMGKNGDSFRALGISAKDPLQAFEQLADLFTQLQDPQQRAAVMAQALGRNWQEAAPLLSKGGQAIAEIVERGKDLSGATTELAKQANLLNDKLAEMSAVGAGGLNTALKALMPMLQAIAESLISAGHNTDLWRLAGTGLAETLRALVVLGGNVTFVFQGIGRDVGAIVAQMEALSNAKALFDMGQYSAAANELKRFNQIHEMAIDDAAKARVAFDKWEASMMAVGSASAATTKILDTQDQVSRRMASNAAAEARDAAARAAAFLAQSQQATFYEQQLGAARALLAKASEEASGGATQLTQAEKTLLELVQKPEFKKLTEDQQTAIKNVLKQADAQEQLNAITKAYADALSQVEAIEKQRDDEIREIMDRGSDRLLQLDDQIDAYKRETEILGQSDAAHQLLQLDLQREKDLRGVVNEATRAGINAQYDELKALVQQRAEAQSQIAIWSELGDKAGQFFSDLVTHGRSAFANLRDMVKQFFAEMVALTAKRWILQLGASITGSAALGNAAASTGENTLSGVGGNIITSVGSNLISGAALSGGSGLLGGVGSTVLESGLSTSIFGTAGLTDSLAFTGTGLAGGVGSAAVAMGASAETAAAIASWVPVIGWVVAIAAVLYAAFGHKGGGPKVGGSFFGSFDSSGNLIGPAAAPGTDNGRFFTPNQMDSDMQKFTTGFEAGYLSTFKALGGTGNPLALSLGIGVDNDPRGTAQSRVSSALMANGNVLFTRRDVGVDDKAVPAEVQHQADQMLLVALQNSNLAPEVEKILNSITDVADATDADIQKVLQQAQEMAGVLEGLKHINLKLTEKDLEGFQLQGETIGQTFQRIATQIGQFDSAFTSDAEKMANAQTMIASTFQTLGVAVPASSQDFYNLVHGLDLSTESGRNMFETLMAVAPAFQSVEAAAAGMIGTFNSIMGQLRGSGFTQNVLQGQLLGALTQFGSTHAFASGWSTDYLLGQILNITPQDFANYVASDPQGAALINTILGTYSQLQQGGGGGGVSGPSASPGLTEGPDQAAWEAQKAAMEAAAQAAQALADAMNQAKTGIADWLSKTLLSPQLSTLSPAEQLQFSQQQYVENLMKAQGGDVTALSSFTQFADAYLQQARSYYASGSSYQEIFAAVTAQAAALAGLADASRPLTAADFKGGVTALVEAIRQLQQQVGAMQSGLTVTMKTSTVQTTQAIQQASQPAPTFGS